MLSERSTIRVINPSYTAAGDIAGGCPDTYIYVTNLVEEFGCKPSMSVKAPDSYQRFTRDVLYAMNMDSVQFHAVQSGGMLPCRRISESRVRENRTHGLMREGRGIRLMKIQPQCGRDKLFGCNLFYNQGFRLFCYFYLGIRG